MTTAINQFLQDFQDMYVDKEVILNEENTNLTGIELKHLEKYLIRLNTDLNALNTLSEKASNEALVHYTKLLDILEDKVNFIGDSADVYNYVNSYFDIRTVRDIHNYNLRSNKSKTCIYDYNQKGLSLKSTNSLYKCSKTIEGSSITFYNTNSSSHSGLQLTSPFLSLLDIKQIIIRRSDGTVLELPVQAIDDNEYYIKHEQLQSSQIIIEFEFYGSTTVLNSYLETIELSLIEYSYVTEGYIPLEVAHLDASDLFTIITDCNLQNNTYANMNLGIELLDINDNILGTMNTTISLNNSVVCKRLDKVNFNEVDSVTALIIKNKRTKSKLTIEYLESLEFKNEKYILYIPKELQENRVNKYLNKLGQAAFKVNTKLVKKIVFTPTLEMFSFHEKSSPIIKHVTGVTKNETI